MNTATLFPPQAVATPAQITLTTGQTAALNEFTAFLMDPSTPVFVLEGFAGTGKSTLVKTLMARLPGLQKASQLLSPGTKEYKVSLTATTNKAAEALFAITSQEVKTIHSHLGLRLETDYRDKNATKLVVGKNEKVVDEIIFIDEASQVDDILFGLIFQQTVACKIVFMGDPAQLLAAKANNSPVFSAGFPTARLTEVVRQAAGNPIIDLATKFRETVSTGVWQQFKPDGVHIIHLPRPEFEESIIDDYARGNWKHGDSMVLAWTNQRVIDYNKAIRDRVMGDPDFQVGDFAMNNSYIQRGKVSMKTDQMVQITKIGDLIVNHGVKGHMFSFSGVKTEFFVPVDRNEAKAASAQAKKRDDMGALMEMGEWADLRAVYAGTINKSQGSTYNTAYIDLDDIKRCTNGNTLARLMYVGVSRARDRVFMTGDLV